MVKWYFPSIVIDLFEFEGRENKYQNKCPSAWDFFIIKCIIKMYKWIYSRKNHKKIRKRRPKWPKTDEKWIGFYHHRNWWIQDYRTMSDWQEQKEKMNWKIFWQTQAASRFIILQGIIRTKFIFFNFRIRCSYQMSLKVNYRNLENLLLLNLKLRKYYLDRPNIFIKNIETIGKNLTVWLKSRFKRRQRVHLKN